MFWSEEGRPAPRPQSQLEPVPRSPGGVGIGRVPWEPLASVGHEWSAWEPAGGGGGVKVGCLSQTVQARHRGAWVGQEEPLYLETQENECWGTVTGLEVCVEGGGGEAGVCVTENSNQGSSWPW